MKKVTNKEKKATDEEKKEIKRYIVCYIKDVYLSGRIDDYVCSIAYPNLYIVLSGGTEICYPIYSTGMYELFKRQHADKSVYQKVDELYAAFVKMIKEKASGGEDAELYKSISRDIDREIKAAEYRRQHAAMQS